MEEKSFFTVKELSERLNILPQSLRRHIKTGNIKAEKVNGSYIIFKRDAERFLQDRAGR